MAYIVAMTSAPKDIKISFRVAYADAVRIISAANDADRSTSDFVRLVVLNHIKEKPNA
jgi:hypothetical protein